MLFRQQFRRDLRAGRFNMEFAASGPAALQCISEAAGVSLILVLSDINMLEMSGLKSSELSVLVSLCSHWDISFTAASVRKSTGVIARAAAIRSFGKCDAPRCSETMKRLPSSTLLSTRTVPQHAAYSSRRGFIGHGTIGNGEMGLFSESVPVDLKQDVVVPSRRAAP
jgi:hypothetical protein